MEECLTPRLYTSRGNGQLGTADMRRRRVKTCITARLSYTSTPHSDYPLLRHHRAMQSVLVVTECQSIRSVTSRSLSNAYSSVHVFQPPLATVIAGHRKLLG